jgi:hypothetical protein
MRRRLLGGDHVAVATSLGDMGSVLRKLGRLDEAEGHFRDAEAIYRRALGDRHPYVATALFVLATSLAGRGALGAAESALGPDHPSTLAAADSLAALQRRTSERTRASEPRAAGTPD